MRRLFKYFTIVYLFACVAGPAAWAQSSSTPADRKEVRAGNRKFKKGDFTGADIDYRRALAKDSLSFAANYNLASTLYRQSFTQDDQTNQANLQSAAAAMSKVADKAAASSDYHFNKGDIAIAQKDWKSAVDAFRESLLLNPNDLDAKENYIYAKKMLENQQNGGGDGESDDNQDNQDQNQDNQDQNQDQNDDKQNQQNNNNQDQEQNQDQSQQKISPQQAQQMLNAIQAKEKETQDKVNKEKAAVLKSRQKEKNW